MKSPDGLLRFGEFTLDPGNRRLLRAGEPVELGGRYLDALVMLASAPGQLISKDRLHDEVWRGVPVTDEALSQAIMALRRALGDDAVRPRYIETVPRHGYRFVATLQSAPEPPTASAPPFASAAGKELIGGLVGAILAGAIVGLAYGGAAASGSHSSGSAISLVMVLVCVSVLAALVSGLGIAGGAAIATRSGRSEWWRPLAGATIGGIVVGGFARLLGIDTLRLLAGSAPDRIAGASEGLAIGIAAGLSIALMARRRRPSRYAIGLVLGGLAGGAVVLAGGTLMAGSLADMVAGFPQAGLTMGWARSPLLLGLSGVLEGALFTALVAGGIVHQSDRSTGS